MFKQQFVSLLYGEHCYVWLAGNSRHWRMVQHCSYVAGKRHIM